MHSCDNPPCCNPAHLSVGTASQNIRDSVARGRWGKNKLTDNDVAEIRQLLEAGWVQQQIARKFNISQPAVSRIATGNGRSGARKKYRLLTPEQWDEVRELDGGGVSRAEIARRFDVSPSTISNRLNQLNNESQEAQHHWSDWTSNEETN